MIRSGRTYQWVCVLTAAAILAGVARPAHLRLAAAKSAQAPGGEGPSDVRDKASGEMDSFAMGLLLGGFRGPLVMYLWVTSEDEKNRDQTEKFMTRSELIGDLQPQFAAIYIHQSWNLAYNVSVQYNRPTEKYRWIRAGIDFAEKGNRRIPGNPNILEQLGHLYYDKLGESFERTYYRARFRQDSIEQLLDKDRWLRDYNVTGELDAPPAQRWRYIDRLDDSLAQALRDQKKNGQFIASDYPPPASDTAQHHRWTYGVSVFAIAYDYFKQAAISGHHANFGVQVMSSLPAIACRNWAEDELNLALAAESRVWPLEGPGQGLPLPAADQISGPGAAPAAIEEAVFHYREAHTVAQVGRANYLAHLVRFPYEGETFMTHLNDVAIKGALGDAGMRRLTGMIELLAANANRSTADRGSEERIRAAREKLSDARVTYLNTIQLIRDYVATEFRNDPWADANGYGRGPYDALADQAARAADQIDRLLQQIK